MQHVQPVQFENLFTIWPLFRLNMPLLPSQGGNFLLKRLRRWFWKRPVPLGCPAALREVAGVAGCALGTTTLCALHIYIYIFIDLFIYSVYIHKINVMHIYILHTYIHAYIHTSIHPSIHTYIHLYIDTYIHTLQYITLEYFTSHYTTLQYITYIHYITYITLHTLHYIT